LQNHTRALPHRTPVEIGDDFTAFEDSPFMINAMCEVALVKGFRPGIGLEVLRHGRPVVRVADIALHKPLTTVQPNLAWGWPP
jgi:hypothetical protein